ncbi:hypothetical protein AWN76_005525 [Rhodothermaceae bacterium RA]|nr:hypothetical protein AWN76_005525 [Rhodothermaceae bacterium RA]
MDFDPKTLLAGLMIAVVVAVAAVLVDRSVFWPEDDAFEQRLRALEDSLARSQALRDSLQADIDRRYVRLTQLTARADSLQRALSDRDAAILRQERLLRTIQGNLTAYPLPDDSLLFDLNRLLREARRLEGAAPR